MNSIRRKRQLLFYSRLLSVQLDRSLTSSSSSSTKVSQSTTTSMNHDEKKTSTPNPSDSKEAINWNNTKRLLQLAKPELKLLFGALLSLGISSGITLLFPAVIGKVLCSNKLHDDNQSNFSHVLNLILNS